MFDLLFDQFGWDAFASDAGEELVRAFIMEEQVVLSPHDIKSAELHAENLSTRPRGGLSGVARAYSQQAKRAKEHKQARGKIDKSELGGTGSDGE